MAELSEGSLHPSFRSSKTFVVTRRHRLDRGVTCVALVTSEESTRRRSLRFPVLSTWLTTSLQLRPPQNASEGKSTFCHQSRACPLLKRPRISLGRSCSGYAEVHRLRSSFRFTRRLPREPKSTRWPSDLRSLMIQLTAPREMPASLAISR
jgi:hypothetical protein